MQSRAFQLSSNICDSPKHSFSAPPRMLTLTLQIEAPFLPVFPLLFFPYPAAYFSCSPEILCVGSVVCVW